MSSLRAITKSFTIRVCEELLKEADKDVQNEVITPKAYEYLELLIDKILQSYE